MSKKTPVSLFILALALAVSQTALVQAQPRRRAMIDRDKISMTRDVEYAKVGDVSLKMDVLEPKEKSDKPRPAVVFIHGGGWRGGNRASGLGQLAPLVQSGNFVGFTISYRLSGQAIWPAQLHDIKSAIRYIRNHAEKYNIDPNRIGAMGPSAGGHLVAMLATTGDVPQLEGTVGPNKGSSKVQCVVDLFGPTELLTMNEFDTEGLSRMDHNSPRSPESLLIGGAIQENKEKTKQASPVTHVSKGDAPILILHGTKDPLVSFLQSKKLLAVCEKAKVPCTLIPVEGAGHGFGGDDVRERIQTFFDQQLRGQKKELNTEPIKYTPPRRRFPRQQQNRD